MAREEGLFRFFYPVEQVLEIALGCSGSSWRSFRIVVKVSRCFHECQDVSRCVWSFKNCFGVVSRSM